MIVGFPGESIDDFNELYDFVKEIKFDKLGVFEYSKEEGTPASTMENQIHYKTKKSRYNKIMSLQQEISGEKMKDKVGTELEVLVEYKSLDGKYFIGRTKNDVPDIDGVVYVKTDESISLNTFIKCEIVEVKDYDLVAVCK